jgi:serine/threonine protein kinase
MGDDGGSSSLDAWLADYELDKPLAAQTHCVTLRAKRKRDGRWVMIRALKTRGRSVAAARDALGQERNVLEAIDHPSIPALLEVRKDGKQLALIIADHGGHRLDVVLDRAARPDPLHAVAIGIDVGRALSALHRHDEPHGAVRAEMIELADHGSVYLHGAGQRRLLHLRGTEEELTEPAYMAPEQILGDPPDERTDVFLFGMLLYRMIAGAPPFDSSEGSVSHHIRHSAPTPLARHINRVPDGLEPILQRCLKKRARDRYADMASVVSELTRVLRAETSLPVEVLVSRLLAQAGLGDELPPPREHGVDRGTATRHVLLQKAGTPVGIGLSLVLAALIGWQMLSGDDANGPSGPRGIVKSPAQLKLLARPWAEIHIDGKMVDVTPIGRPVEVTPGRHTVVFKHPNAPDEARPIEIVAGQTILLDIEMNVVRPADAGRRGDADVDESP